MFENMEMLLSESARRGIPAMELTLYHKGRQVYHTVRGVKEEDGTKLVGGELYNAYSCSKLITCALALKLVEEGKLHLDDNLCDYLPAFSDMKVKKCGGIEKAEKKIKIFNLFNMSAGFSYNVDTEEIARGREETEGRCPTVKMMDYISKTPLEYEAGEGWQYSLAHDVLAAVVEVVSGKRFGEFANEKIFLPLGMKDSTFLLPKSRLDELCSQYIYEKKTKKFVNIGKEIYKYKLGSEYESGGAGLISCVPHFIKFLEAMRTYKLLNQDIVAKMKTDYLSEEQRIPYSPWGLNGYGYGLGVRTPIGMRTDYGWGGAAGAIAVIDEPHEMTLYYSQHVLSSPASALRKDYVEAAKIDLGYTDADVKSMWHGTASHLA